MYCHLFFTIVLFGLPLMQSDPPADPRNRALPDRRHDDSLRLSPSGAVPGPRIHPSGCICAPASFALDATMGRKLKLIEESPVTVSLSRQCFPSKRYILHTFDLAVLALRV